MKISIIVPAYNSQKTIAVTVAACLAIEWPDKEVIVVDDGSTDATAEIVRAAGSAVRLIQRQNGGPAAARNTGWKAASGEICYFTDADCLPHPDILASIAPFYGDPSVGGVGGTYGIANPHNLLARLIHEEIMFRHAAMEGEVDYLGSFNLSYRRTVLERVGGFDETYRTASGEDNDLAYRARKAGHRLMFAPKAVVDHFHEESLAQYLRRQYHHGIWRMKLYRAHSDMAKGDKYAGIADLVQPPLALAALALLPLTAFGPARPLVVAVWGAYLLLLSVLPVRITASRGSLEPLLLVPVVFLRGVARGLGLVKGVLKFGLPG